MYTMVMMMAMSGSADTASFGGKLFNRGGSCHGSVAAATGCQGSFAAAPVSNCHGMVVASTGCGGHSRGGMLGLGMRGKLRNAFGHNGTSCGGGMVVSAPVAVTSACPEFCPTTSMLVHAPVMSAPVVPATVVPGTVVPGTVVTPTAKPEPAKMPEVKKSEPSRPKVEDKKNEKFFFFVQSCR